MHLGDDSPFYELEPAFDNKNFKMYQANMANKKFDQLIETVIQLNKAIAEDSSLGEGFRIGHSYFCGCDLIDNDWINELVEYELIPLMKEYWFDEPSKVEQWSNKLRGITHD